MYRGYQLVYGIYSKPRVATPPRPRSWLDGRFDPINFEQSPCRTWYLLPGFNKTSTVLPLPEPVGSPYLVLSPLPHPQEICALLSFIPGCFPATAARARATDERMSASRLPSRESMKCVIIQVSLYLFQENEIPGARQFGRLTSEDAAPPSPGRRPSGGLPKSLRRIRYVYPTFASIHL